MPRHSAALARLQQRNHAIAQNQLRFTYHRALYPSEMPAQVSLWSRIWTRLVAFWVRLKEVVRGR